MTKRGKLLSGVVTTFTVVLLVYVLSQSTQTPAPDRCEQALSAAVLASTDAEQNTLVDNALLQQPSCDESSEAPVLR